MPFLPSGFAVPERVETPRFRLRSSFDDAAMSLDEARLLGCVYVDPPHDEGTDADLWFWARQSELAAGLEDEPGAFGETRLARDWPFAIVTIHGARRVLAK